MVMIKLRKCMFVNSFKDRILPIQIFIVTFQNICLQIDHVKAKTLN